MFTVKATYRGETRKFSFSESNSFPSFVQLYNQLYRIFPHLGCNYYLSKLLFSPDSSEARILIGKEAHTAEEYHRYLASPSLAGPWPNPLLKFDVFDGNPYKSALNSIAQPSWGIPWRTPPAMSPVGNIALPSPCPINFNPRPLSYPMPPPPILFPSPPTSASSRPMPPVWHDDTSAASSPLAPQQHYAPLYSQFYSKPQQKPFVPQTQTPTPTPQGNTCCAVTEARQDVHKALHEFKQDLERILENLDVRGSSTNTPVKHNSCSKCGETFFRGQQFSCANCSTVLCYSCKHFSLPTTCRDGLLHVFPDSCAPNTWPPAPQFTPFIPEMQTPVTPFIPPFSPLVQAPSIPRMDGWPAAVPYSHVSPKVTHHGVVCDDCDMTIEGIRHKCLDCNNYDLCSNCIGSGGAERHNAFHEFIELKEPGRVIVHVVGDRNVPPANETSPSPVATTPIETVPAIHNATCDLCDSRIRGDRYKCVCCPDFDTCGACFTITPEQHPHHTFVRISSPVDLINRQNAPISHQSHHATCNICMKTIRGVRYKCMHPSCPDFDLCDRCEAHPIATHPDNHPLLKMKKPETVIPTVYRVGMTTLIDSEDRGRSLTRLSTPLSYKSASRSRSPSPEPLHWFRTWQPAEQQRIPRQFPFGLRTPSPPRATSPPPVFTPPPPPLPPKGGMYWNYTPVPTSPPTIPERPPQFLYDPQYVAPTPYMYQPETPAGYNPSYMNLNRVEEGQVDSSLRTPSPIAKRDDLVERAIVEYPPVSYNISGPSFQRRLSVGEDSHSEELFLPDAPNFVPFQCRRVMSPIGSDTVPPALSRPVSPAVCYPDLLSLLQPPKGSPVTQDETFLTPIGDHTPLPVPEHSSAERPLSRLQSFLSDSPPHGKKAFSPSSFEFFDRSIQKGSEVSSYRSHSLLDLLNEIPPRSRFSVSDVSRDTPSTIFAQATDSPRNEDKLHSEITRFNQSPDIPFSADFIEDITVTDGQIFPPGAEFVKSWKMKNSGRDWDETTELVFVAGESFSCQVPLAPVLVGSLKSGEEIDLYTGELKAPDAPGRYVGYWRLKNSSCHLFGASIWIDITVAEHNSGRESAALSAMSSSSVIIMPTGAVDITKQLDTMSMSTTVAVTATSGSDVISLDGSDASFSGVSAPSSDDDWEDGRLSVPVAGAQTAPEYVVLYDDSSSEGEA